MQFALPQILLLLAAVVLVTGIRRLTLPASKPPNTTRRALFVWLLLLMAGVSVWLLAIAHRL